MTTAVPPTTKHQAHLNPSHPPKANGVECVHPGYGFLSENSEFAAKCEANGIAFVGPTVANLEMFGDKTSARETAIKAGVPVVPGTDGPVTTVEQAREFIEGGDQPVGYPVIVKAAMGGGGRGMRVITNSGELEEGKWYKVIPSFTKRHEVLRCFTKFHNVLPLHPHHPHHPHHPRHYACILGGPNGFRRWLDLHRTVREGPTAH